MKDEKAQKLQALCQKIQNDPHYRNEKMGDIFVPGVGPPDAAVVMIGEAPGQEEERERSPFVGAAGRNLNVLLKSIGLHRDRIYITNLVKYRPFDSKGNNRKPTLRESRYALPYLIGELEILTPKVVVCLGSSPAAALLAEPNLKMGKANGVWYEKHGLRILVSYHPSPFNYLNPQRKKALQDTFEKLAETVK